MNTEVVVQTKTKRFWWPSDFERRVGRAVRLAAEQEATRIPWPRLQEAREKYVGWEAFVLWVRAIEDAEGGFPKWLAEFVDKRCRGFLKFLAENKLDHLGGTRRFWNHLEHWINERIFGKVWREGWMNAVGYYATRDLVSLRNHAYWEYSEREWKRSKPDPYPSFREWLEAADHCSDRVLDECEVPEDKRRLAKLSQRVDVRTLRRAVERYVEWELFAYWTRTAVEANLPLPASVDREMKKRCPGFSKAGASVRGASPHEERHCRFNRMMKWIEDHEFSTIQKRGWFDVLLYQAHLHARHARVIDYWHDWEAGWAKLSTAKYPPFRRWRDAADRYTFECEGS